MEVSKFTSYKKILKNIETVILYNMSKYKNVLLIAGLK